MSDIITAYPTSGLTDRSFNSLNTAFFEYISNIPEVAQFFDSIEKLGDGTTTSYSDYGIKFIKGNSYLRIAYNTGYALRLDNNGNNYASNATQATNSVDISVRSATGINGTTAIWFDEYNKGVCMLFNEYEGKCFLANSSSNSTNSFYYSDTGGTVGKLVSSFNGSNIGTGGDYITQPYYHLGINTGDIYTFDGGSEIIPYGKFKIGNAEFVKLTSNFALRLK